MDWVRDKGPELQLYFNLFQFNSYLFLLINFVYKAGDTPLMYALGKGISYPIIEFMIDKGANVKDKSKVIIFFMWVTKFYSFIAVYNAFPVWIHSPANGV